MVQYWLFRLGMALCCLVGGWAETGRRKSENVRRNLFGGRRQHASVSSRLLHTASQGLSVSLLCGAELYSTVHYGRRDRRSRWAAESTCQRAQYILALAETQTFGPSEARRGEQDDLHGQEEDTNRTAEGKLGRVAVKRASPSRLCGLLAESGSETGRTR